MVKRIVCLLLICVLLTACGQKVETLTWQEQYDLGLRYLSEGNYEEAILAFNAAIEIDPKQPEAYVELAKLYTEQGDVEKLTELLDKAKALFGEEEFMAMLREKPEADEPENNPPLDEPEKNPPPENYAANACGDNLTWSLSADGTLTISGTGDMWDWTDQISAPWKECGEVVKSVIMEEGVTAIGDYSFDAGFYLNLTSVQIPETVKRVGRCAFCANAISYLYIPKSVEYIGSQAFTHLINLSEVAVDPENANFCTVDGVLFSKDMKRLYVYPSKKSGSDYTIPDEVETVEINAFNNNNFLTSITIHAGVSYIETTQTFSYCESLENIFVDDENQYYCDVNGVLFNKDRTELLFHPEARAANTYEVPAGVTRIDECAFEGSKLSRIILPEGLVEIGDGMFNNLINMNTITIPKTVTVLGTSCFWSGYDSIFFLGDVPAVWEEYAVGEDVKIYYAAGAKGWTTPTWTSPDGRVYNTEPFTP